MIKEWKTSPAFKNAPVAIRELVSLDEGGQLQVCDLHP